MELGRTRRHRPSAAPPAGLLILHRTLTRSHLMPTIRQTHSSRAFQALPACCTRRPPGLARYRPGYGQRRLSPAMGPTLTPVRSVRRAPALPPPSREASLAWARASVRREIASLQGWRKPPSQSPHGAQTASLPPPPRTPVSRPAPSKPRQASARRPAPPPPALL